jgi:hypothetical protein
MGCEVQILRGVSAPVPRVDLLIPQVDLTRTPRAYRRHIERFPRVLNRRVTDISKRRISTNLLTRGSVYDGPVVVKTDCNHGGLPESRAFPATFGWLNRLRRKLAGARPDDLRYASVLPRGEYPVYARLGDVPAGVWSNRQLVVERFIPERRDGHYCIRVCLCLGDVVLNRRVCSRDPIIKGGAAISEEAPVPAALLAFRERLGLDYGKIDYVVHGGDVQVLDANRTPGILGDAAVDERISRKLAAGIWRFVPA